MFKKLFSIIAFAVAVTSVSAQAIEEPEFVGESIIVKNDNTVIPLEKQVVQEGR